MICRNAMSVVNRVTVARRPRSEALTSKAALLRAWSTGSTWTAESTGSTVSTTRGPLHA